MGHFTLQLPTGEQADVREGVISRKTVSLRSIFGGQKTAPDKKRAYIIHVGQKEYRLLRSMEGDWLAEGMGNFVPTVDDALSTALKKEIQQHENNR